MFLMQVHFLNSSGVKKCPLMRLGYNCGFNGYYQCPKNEDGLPPVIAKWISILKDETLNACTHRFVVVETAEIFKIYGVLSETSNKRVQEVPKPAEFQNFGSSDTYLIGINGKSIWKYYYRNLKWLECEIKFLTEEEKSDWGNAGSRILKFSFLDNVPDVILLLSNGSVWLLSEENELKLLFPHDLDKAIDISSGLEHSLILTESGCVLSFGNGSRGQLGHGDLNAATHPIQIAALEGLKVTNIGAGGWHSCAVTDSGDLYTWGWNNYGQLSAFEDGEEVCLTALPICVEVGEKFDIKVVDVACGRRHTVASLENEELYSTGWNAYNQLGIELPCEKITKFTRCQIKRSQKGKVICGPWYTILVKEHKQ